MTDGGELDHLYNGFQPLEDWLAVALDVSLWDEWRAALAVGRDLAEPTAFEKVLQEVLRQAAIDTGAVEQLYETERGFTITVAAMATAWEAELVAQKGEDVARMVTGHKTAYDLALDIATKSIPVNEAIIRRIHQEACAGQDRYEVRTPLGPQTHPLPKGEYKRHRNHVELADGSAHVYAPVAEVPSEMHRLVSVLQSDLFAEVHPVVQAAWSHHALVTVHPFADGNGRVARVLASIFLFRAASIPFVLFADQRGRYFESLAAADGGQAEVFEAFVRDRSLDTLLFVTEALRQPTTATTIGRLQTATARRREAHQAGRRLHELLIEEIRALADPYIDLEDVMLTIEPASGIGIPSGYRFVQDTNPSYFFLSAQASGVGVGETFAAVVSDVLDKEFPVGVLALDSEDSFWARVTDVLPEPSSALRLRLHQWVERVVNNVLTRLADAVDPTGDASG